MSATAPTLLGFDEADALDLMDALVARPMNLSEIAESMGVTRHRARREVTRVTLAKWYEHLAAATTDDTAGAA